MSIFIFNNGILQQNPRQQENFYLDKKAPQAANNNLATLKTLSYLNTDRDSLDNRRRLLASHVMSSPVITVFAHDLVSQALHLMSSHDISHVVVINELSKPLGILYINEIVKLDSPATSFIQNTLNTRAIAVSENTLVRDIAATFMQQKCTAVTVVDSQHKIVGIISRNDLMGLLISSPNQKIKA
ncbi:MAG: hypothetical protein OFPII_04010 [Osedax symbiont Rs1]|nr:MAG: hypothetical protein OFPII_04010 [Osedax symbiont Rs1]